MCAYRRFRFWGHKSFGWDVWAIHWGGESWSPPRRLTEQFGFADTPYRVLARERSLLVAGHCCQHIPRKTWVHQQEEARARTTQHTWDHRVELWEIPEGKGLPEEPLGHEVLAAVIPTSGKEIRAGGPTIRWKIK